MKEFGKVEFCSRYEVKEGFLLRETRTGVVFEQIDCNGTDVVAEFEGARINDNSRFGTYLMESREYVGDKNTLIYVDLSPWNAEINQT